MCRRANRQKRPRASSEQGVSMGVAPAQPAEPDHGARIIAVTNLESVR